MSVSTSTAAWIAIGAAAVGIVALLVVLWIWLRVRKLREGQMVLLGGGESDLVDFAVSLQGRIDDLHRAVDEAAAGPAPPRPPPHGAGPAPPGAPPAAPPGAPRP